MSSGDEEDVAYDEIQKLCGVIDLSKFPPPPILRLKDMRLKTPLVSEGKVLAAIVVPKDGRYDGLAKRIATQIKRLTGETLPVLKDSETALPFSRDLIVLGNRSTNAVVDQLYNLYYTCLDLRHPGPGGYDVRSLHDPFGNGFNMILIGSSDDLGMKRAVGVFIDVVRGEARREAQKKSLTLGRVARVKLGRGTRLPKDANRCSAWEDSVALSGATSFGWNSLSRNMFLYYITGDERYAKDFLRIAFPDESAIREMWEIDGERMEDKQHPISGPYHYNAHLMILLWDLIEESPAFTDEQRLRITREFSDQLRHWQREWCYPGKRFGDTRFMVNTRHDQYHALSLYCLSRYFCKYYPHVVWQRNMESSQQLFASLRRSMEVQGEMDHLTWFPSGLEPLMSYMLISGDRSAQESGALATQLRAYDALIDYRRDHEYISLQSLSFAHKAAYLTGDNRFIYYRNLISLDTRQFRIGQSFYPPDESEREPIELVNKIVVSPLSREMWNVQTEPVYPHIRPVSIPIPYERTFQFLGYHTGLTDKDDYIMVDGFHGGTRNPYHCFAVTRLRIRDIEMLNGYMNEFIIRQGGLTEPEIPVAAALDVREVLGDLARIEAEVPNFSHGTWRRRIIHLTNRWTLFVDEFTARSDSPEMEMVVQWQSPAIARVAEGGWFELDIVRRHAAIVPWVRAQLTVSMDTHEINVPWVSKMPAWSNPLAKCITLRDLKAAEVSRIITLMGPQPVEGHLMCSKLATGAALLETPDPVLAAIGLLDIPELRLRVKSDVALVSGDFVYGAHIEQVSVGLPVLESDGKISLYWSLIKGEVEAFCDEPAPLGISVASGGELKVDGLSPIVTHVEDGLVWIRLDRGTHKITGAKPRELTSLEETLAALRGRSSRPDASTDVTSRLSGLPEITPYWSGKVDEAIVDILQGPEWNGSSVCYLLTESKAYPVSPGDGLGKPIGPGTKIMSAAYWKEAGLLLLGCSDDVVYAYDERGDQKWTFESEMAPEVRDTAKTYWFKDAFPGVWGLATGSLLEGGTQAFVGSACTIEVIDSDGRLVKRVASFWGNNITMSVLAKPDGSRKLLSSKIPNGVNTISIVDSRDWSVDQGFTELPPGHTRIPDWANTDSRYLTVSDIDGDGRSEVVVDVNGQWNHVCAYDPNGKPLWSLSFGPSFLSPHRYVRDMCVEDIDEDGRKETVVATEDGILSAFDCEGKRNWYTRLGTPTCVAVLRGGSGVRIAAGQEDGTIWVLDAGGKPVSRSKMDSSVEALRSTGDDGLVVAGTSSGTVAILNANA